MKLARIGVMFIRYINLFLRLFELIDLAKFCNVIKIHFDISLRTFYAMFLIQALAVIEYLIANGSERAVDEIIEHTFQISVRF